MKKIVWLVFSVMICSNAYAESNYYYCKDKKINLGYSTNRILITFKKRTTSEQRTAVLQEISKYNTSVFEHGNVDANVDIPSWAIISLNSSNEQLVKEKLLAMAQVAYASRMYSANSTASEKDQLLGITNEILVEISNGFSRENLINEAAKYNCTIKAQSKVYSNRYILSCDKHEDVVSISNEIHLSGVVNYAHPNFLRSNVLASDPYYYKQWYMYNPTDRAVDNNVDDAHAVTMGRPEIKIAIMDTGVEYEHEDLDGQFIIPGYSPSGLIVTGKPAGWYYGSHGTMVAGVAAGIADNGIGIKGVAPKCKYVSILVSAGVPGFSFEQEIVDGLDWSWANGVDVVNMSLYIASPTSAYYSAVDRATSNGRGGLGCVVVAATGNYQGVNPISGLVTYDKVIAVGATDKLKQRAPYANYDNSSVDVVAPVGYSLVDANANPLNPQDLCFTTHALSPDYYEDWGTSLAAPQVAGLAGLILSVNPCLNYTYVKNVIENTADKMSPNLYRYCTDWSNHPNGTWNPEVGYGKINCGRAVRRAIDMMGMNGVSSNTTTTSSTSLTLNLVLPTPPSGTNPCVNIPTGSYTVSRIPVTHIYDRTHWPIITYDISSNGISPDVSPLSNNGAAYVNITYPAWNQIAITTYVYQILSGSYSGMYYPVAPSDVKFFIGRDKYNTFYLQNITENAFVHEFKNVEPIEAGYNVTSLISPGNYTLQGENRVKFISKEIVRLMPGFSVDAHNNNYFEARIGHYNMCNPSYPNGLEKTSTDNDTYIVEGKTEKNLFAEQISTPTTIHPNPTTGQLNITMPAPGDYEVKISNMLGVVVYQGKLKDEQQKQVQLDASLPSGNYTVQITGKEVNHIEKITLTR